MLGKSQQRSFLPDFERFGLNGWSDDMIIFSKEGL